MNEKIIKKRGGGLYYLLTFGLSKSKDKYDPTLKPTIMDKKRAPAILLWLLLLGVTWTKNMDPNIRIVVIIPEKWTMVSMYAQIDMRMIEAVNSANTLVTCFLVFDSVSTTLSNEVDELYW